MLLSKKLLFYRETFPRVYTSGSYDVELMPGTYKFILRGGGGAGGSTSARGGGSGGCGGKGSLQEYTKTFYGIKRLRVFVGRGGLTYAAGGNGGSSNSNSTNVIGGFGGGGGMPSYVSDSVTNSWLFANGGGGGGGGGANAAPMSRYADAGSGGGGGGYYRLNTWFGRVDNVSGQTGSLGGGDNDGRGVNGVEGNTADFPDIISGTGGRGGYSSGWRTSGGTGANGGGASGGGGGAGAGNHTSSRGGGGGGGAGGCPDAGGGAGGAGREAGTNGYNHHTTPTDTTGENALYGVIGNFGIGGAPEENGMSGFVKIEYLI